MSNKKYVFGFVVIALFAFVSASSALAEDSTATVQNNTAPLAGQVPGQGRGMMIRGDRGVMGRNEKGMMKPGVFGKVTAVSGNTITVTAKKGDGTTATDVTFTIDATNAKIMKDNVAGTIASIAVGDNIMAEGTLTGTNLVATVVRDNKMMPPIMRGGKGENEGKNGEDGNGNTIMMTGNGQPVVAGKVSVLNGNTITITNASNVTYTIDATSAKFAGKNLTTISNVKTGDMLIAQGTVNGNAVVATSVIDQGQAPVASTTSGTTTPAPQGEHKGFFGGVGAFFGHLFGF